MAVEAIDEQADLIRLPQTSTALFDIFTEAEPVKVTALLNMARQQIDGFLAAGHDAKTTKGAKEIKSFAYAIARQKSAIDKVGKDLTDKQKELPKRIDAARKLFRDTLDKWADEVRAPVTAEEARTARIQDDLRALSALASDKSERTLAELVQQLPHVEVIDPAAFDEQASVAATLKASVLDALRLRIAQAEKREADAAELARLRDEAAARERRDRDVAIAKLAAERATAEAAAEFVRREQGMKLMVERAEQAKAEALARAARAAEDAQQAAEKAAHEAKAREEADQKRRAADKAHKTRINRTALEALMAAGVSEECGRLVITLIATGNIPAISIRY